MSEPNAKTTRESAPAQPPPSLRERFFDYLTDARRLPSIGKELAYAVADIRQKLVEEAAYGRAVTPDHRVEPDDGRDPLGRSAAEDPFRERCRRTFHDRPPVLPERDGHGPDR